MAEVAHNVDREFWQPPIGGNESPQPATVLVPSHAAEACEECGTEFMVGANFCHTCGTARPVVGAERSARFNSLVRHMDFQNIKAGLGLPTASLIFFLVGIACAVSAIAVGFIYSAPTVLDWQAIQAWRIQWLLGSSAAFIAAILLKRPAR
jgi:hypothetical protein